MLNLNEQNFKKTLEKGRFVVDIWQDGCEPCKQYGPLFLAAENIFPEVKFGQFKVVNKNAPSEFRRTYLTFDKDEFSGSPTTVLIEDGKMIARHCGYMTLRELNDFIYGAKVRPMSELTIDELKVQAFDAMRAADSFFALNKDSLMTYERLREEIAGRE